MVINPQLLDGPRTPPIAVCLSGNSRLFCTSGQLAVTVLQARDAGRGGAARGRDGAGLATTGADLPALMKELPIEVTVCIGHRID